MVKLFDSWAGALPGAASSGATRSSRPAGSSRRSGRPHPGVPVIGFPRGAGAGYIGFAAATGVEASRSTPRCAAVGGGAAGRTAASRATSRRLLVTGGQALVDETTRIVRAFSGGPHIFNLGHGITPDADPANVEVMLDAIRGMTTVRWRMDSVWIPYGFHTDVRRAARAVPS